MWTITRFLGSDITMFEYETEKEAREALKNMKGYTILTEVIYFNDTRFERRVA